jgi:hypothetical protein
LKTNHAEAKRSRPDCALLTGAKLNLGFMSHRETSVAI